MKYQFSVQEPYKTFLLNWQKTIEWRLNRWKFVKIKKWDILQFETWESFLIEDITRHESFMDMITKFGRGCIIPDAKDDKQAINIYHRFYSSEDEKRYWVCAIHVKRL